MKTYKWLNGESVGIYENGVFRGSCFASALPEGVEILPADPHVRDILAEIDALERAALENRKNREMTLETVPAQMLLYLREGLLDPAVAAQFTDANVQAILGDPSATVAGLTVAQMKTILGVTNYAYARTKALDDQIRALRELL